MMGAMPAVAVQLERRRAEYRFKRPAHMSLADYPPIRPPFISIETTAPQPCPELPIAHSSHQVPPPAPHPSLETPTPHALHSPHTSIEAPGPSSPRCAVLPAPQVEESQLEEVFLCGKISALYVAVVSLLLGTVVLVVGLVQLKPGADPPGHRYYLIACGCCLEVFGLIVTATRCFLLHKRLLRREPSFCSYCRRCDRAVYHVGPHQIQVTTPIVKDSNGTSQDLTPMPVDSDSFHEGRIGQIQSRDMSYPNGSSPTPSPTNSISSVHVVISGIVIERQPRPSPQSLSPIDTPHPNSDASTANLN